MVWYFGLAKCAKWEHTKSPSNHHWLHPNHQNTPPNTPLQHLSRSERYHWPSLASWWAAFHKIMAVEVLVTSKTGKSHVPIFDFEGWKSVECWNQWYQCSIDSKNFNATNHQEVMTSWSAAFHLVGCLQRWNWPKQLQSLARPTLPHRSQWHLSHLSHLSPARHSSHEDAGNSPHLGEAPLWKIWK